MSLQGVPVEFLQHSSDTACASVVICYMSSCPALNHLDLLVLCFCVSS